jgi:hypothetical protein
MRLPDKPSDHLDNRISLHRIVIPHIGPHGELQKKNGGQLAALNRGKAPALHSPSHHIPAERLRKDETATDQCNALQAEEAKSPSIKLTFFGVTGA